MGIIQANSNGRIDYRPVFERFSDELYKIKQTLTLTCAGGFVMQINGYRGTADVDAFYKSSAEIEAIIRTVGEEFNLNKPDELWLNNSLSSLNPEPPDEYCEVIYDLPNLLVKVVNAYYFIGMKLISGREQDVIDVGAVLKHDKNECPIELFLKLKAMRFDIDISVLLDAYEKAHGMDWLDNYYTKNQNELYRYF